MTEKKKNPDKQKEKPDMITKRQCAADVFADAMETRKILIASIVAILIGNAISTIDNFYAVAFSLAYVGFAAYKLFRLMSKVKYLQEQYGV